MGTPAPGLIDLSSVMAVAVERGGRPKREGDKRAPRGPTARPVSPGTRTDRLWRIMKYRKRPVVVEAVQFTGHNDAEVLDFCPIARDPVDTKANLIIPTPEGEMLVSIGDWVIRGVKGEFYPCKPDIFKETYEPC